MRLKQWIQSYTGILRSFKGVYLLHNLWHARRLSHLKSFYRRLGIRKNWWSSIESSDLPKAEKKEAPWLDQDNAQESLDEELSKTDFKPRTSIALRQWPEKGYSILEGFF